jgi:hypothetical protein
MALKKGVADQPLPFVCEHYVIKREPSPVVLPILEGNVPLSFAVLSLKELQIRDEYRSDGQRPAPQGHRDHLIQDFYIPCLERSSGYSRAVGFFSSSSMAAVAQGLAAFVRSQGRMRLVTSPKLSNDDVEAIRKAIRSGSARGLQGRDQVIERALLRELEQDLEQMLKDRLACLAWLLSQGVLDIKLAIPKSSRQWGI